MLVNVKVSKALAIALADPVQGQERGTETADDPRSGGCKPTR